MRCAPLALLTARGFFEQCQLADLGLQWYQVYLRLYWRTIERLGRALNELALPIGDLIGMQFKLLTQLCHGLVLAQCGKSHTGLELGSVGTAYSACHCGFLLQFHRENSNTPGLRQAAKNRLDFHLSYCSNSSDHFLSELFSASSV